MRFAATTLLAAMAAAAMSQTFGPATSAVQSAMYRFATNRSIRLSVSGVETLDSASTTQRSELYWWLSDVGGTRGDLLGKVEFTDYKNGLLVQRAVGDGKSFYNYNPYRNSYWVTSYGSHGAAQPARYLANLVDDFTSAMKGSSTYLARFLREAYVVGGFRQWIPGGSERMVVKDQTVRDPVIPSRVYTGLDDLQYAMFWIGSPAKKSLVFELSRDASGSFAITKFWYAEKSSVGGKARLIDWGAEVFTDFVPASNDFVFIPPAGAKPVVGPRPNIG